MSCALDRSPPRKLYLLLLAQPPRITPYTAMLLEGEDVDHAHVDAGRHDQMDRLVAFRRRPATANQLPNGTTANTASAAARITTGAMTNSRLSTCAGVYSSLKMNFRPSASGCPRPNRRSLMP